MLLKEKKLRLRNLLLFLFAVSSVSFLLAEFFVVMIVAAIVSLVAIYFAAILDVEIYEMNKEHTKHVARCLSRIKFDGLLPNPHDVVMVPESVITIEVD